MGNGERGIPVIDGNIPYQQFLDLFLRPLKPCILSGLAVNWAAAKEWTATDAATGTLVPNFSVLKELFGEFDGCVTLCGEENANNDAVQRDMSVSQFIDDIQSTVHSGLYKSTRKTYLKDFHFMRVNLSIKQPYSVPIFFQGNFCDDWYNRFAIAFGKDDFRFLYLGEHLSSTPLHHDVCMSHSWSTSLCGTKTWTLVAPEYAEFLVNPTTGGLPKSIESTDPQYPNLHKARAVAITIQQFPGETIFVPSGWYHQVVNNGPTLSLNHNWFNAACLSRMYDSLCVQHALSAYAIRDLRDDMQKVEYEGLVQGLLKANYGMDWTSWWELIEWNVRYRQEDACRENRMDEDEEKMIVRKIVEGWLRRSESELLPQLREQVVAFREYLMRGPGSLR